MESTAMRSLEAQVAKVSRRLLLQSWLRKVAACWAALLAVTAIWLLVEPFLWPSINIDLRNYLVIGSLIAGTAFATFSAFRSAPSRTQAALALDDRFDLRERTVTAFSLDPELISTPAGQALLDDASQRVQKLNVADRFPISLPWSTSMVPALAVVVALIAVFYHPSFPSAQGTTSEKLLSTEAKKELDKSLQELVKKPKPEEKPSDRPKSEDLQRLEAKLEELARQPRDTAKQLRDRLKDMQPLEEEIKKLDRDRSDKARMLQQQLQSKDGLMPNDSPKDGPAKELTKALVDGDLDKAQKELDQLAKKLQKNEMKPEDKENLKKQLDDLAKNLNKLAEQKQKEEQLKKLAQEGKLDPEALQRELDKLKKDNEKLADLKKLASKLEQSQKSLQSGDCDQAGMALGEAGQQLGKIDLETQELEDLRDQLQRLKDAKDSLCKNCDSMEGAECNGGDCNGDGDGTSRSKPGRKDYGKGAAEGASGRRPEDEQGKTNSFDARVSGQFNPKGKKIFDGYVPGQAFKKKPNAELAGEIQQAAQEAPEAIEVQRIPKAAREMAKGYFRNLGGQSDSRPKTAETPESKK